MMKKTLITICIILIVGVAGAITAYADAGGDFTLYPSHTHNGNKNWIIREAAAGDNIEETMVLENLSDKRLEISLLMREAKEENGKFITNTSTSFENIGSWITAEGNSYTLEPHRKIEIPFTISVPTETANGQYAAAIFASKKDAAGPSLNIVTQIGVRLYLTVSSEKTVYGHANIFGTPEYGESFLIGLSAIGLISSIFYYMITRKETKKETNNENKIS